MKNLLPALLGLAFLFACLWGARIWVERQLTDQVSAEVVSFKFAPTSATTGRVEVKLEVRNPTKLKATFKGLDGTLSVADQGYAWTLDGLQPGDRLAAGQTRAVTMLVPLTLSDVMGTAATGILTGRVEASFTGTLVASAFGVEVELPLTEQRRLSLWRR
jgi:hypothetical protein